MILRDKEAFGRAGVSSMDDVPSVEQGTQQQLSSATSDASIVGALRARGYGGQTSEALKAFQKDQGLPVTGQLSPLTISALRSFLPNVGQQQVSQRSSLPKFPGAEALNSIKKILLGGLPTDKNDPRAKIWNLFVGASALTGLLYLLDSKRNASVIADKYNDVYSSDDDDEDDDDNDESDNEDVDDDEDE